MMMMMMMMGAASEGRPRSPPHHLVSQQSKAMGYKHVRGTLRDPLGDSGKRHSVRRNAGGCWAVQTDAPHDPVLEEDAPAMASCTGRSHVLSFVSRWK